MVIKDAMSAAATTLIAAHSLGRNKRIVASPSTTTHHKVSHGTIEAGTTTGLMLPSPGFMGSGKSACLHRADFESGERAWVC